MEKNTSLEQKSPIGVIDDNNTIFIPDNVIKISVTETRDGQKTFYFNGGVSYIEYLTKININIIALGEYVDGISTIKDIIIDKDNKGNSKKTNIKHLTSSVSKERIKGEGDIVYYNSSQEFYIEPDMFGKISMSLVKGMIGNVTYESVAKIDYSRVFPKINATIPTVTSEITNDNGSSVTSISVNENNNKDNSIVVNLQQNDSYVREVTWYANKAAKGGEKIKNTSLNLLKYLEENDFKGALSIKTVLTQGKAIQTFST
jgi:hypothetical protein